MFRMFGSSKPRQGGEGINELPAGGSVHLALYKYDSCPFCQRVFHAIDQLGLDIEYRDIRTDYEHRKSLQAATGRTTVPCLFIDGRPMFESSEIVYWLQSSFDRA